MPTDLEALRAVVHQNIVDGVLSDSIQDVNNFDDKTLREKLVESSKLQEEMRQKIDKNRGKLISGIENDSIKLPESKMQVDEGLQLIRREQEKQGKVTVHDTKITEDSKGVVLEQLRDRNRYPSYKVSKQILEELDKPGFTKGDRSTASASKLKRSESNSSSSYNENEQPEKENRCCLVM